MNLGKFLKSSGFPLRSGYFQSEHASFFNLMPYDMHGTWDQDKWTGTFLDAHTDPTEIKSALDLLWRNDVQRDRVVMGVAFYGRSYTTKGLSAE